MEQEKLLIKMGMSMKGNFKKIKEKEQELCIML